MPSVRTENQPMRVPHTVAMARARTTASPHGQPRLISVPLVAKIAYMYPAMPATVIWASDTMPP